MGIASPRAQTEQTREKSIDSSPKPITAQNTGVKGEHRIEPV